MPDNAEYEFDDLDDEFDYLEDEYGGVESFEPIVRGMRREGEGEPSKKKNKKKNNKQAREAKEFKPVYVEEEYDD